MLHTRYMAATGCEGSSYVLNGFSYGMKLVPDAFSAVGLDSLYSFILRLVYPITLLLDHDWSTGVSVKKLRIFFMQIFTQKTPKPYVSTNHTATHHNQPAAEKFISHL